VSKTEWIVMGGIWLFVIVAYCLGTWATMRAKYAVREMDKQDDAEAQYEKIMRDMKVWTKGGRE
jgi:hypothetical protein